MFFCIDTPTNEVKDEDFFYGSNYEETRQKAADDYLHNWLCLRENEVKIESTKMSKDITTNIMWINTTEEDIKKIYRKAGQVKNSKVKLHTFFPSQVWERKVELTKLCMEEKNKDKDFKFIIEPGNKDIELLKKRKGEPFWLKNSYQPYG